MSTTKRAVVTVLSISPTDVITKLYFAGIYQLNIFLRPRLLSWSACLREYLTPCDNNGNDHFLSTRIPRSHESNGIGSVSTCAHYSIKRLFKTRSVCNSAARRIQVIIHIVMRSSDSSSLSTVLFSLPHWYDSHIPHARLHSSSLLHQSDWFSARFLNRNFISSQINNSTKVLLIIRTSDPSFKSYVYLYLGYDVCFLLLVNSFTVQTNSYGVPTIIPLRMFFGRQPWSIWLPCWMLKILRFENRMGKVVFFGLKVLCFCPTTVSQLILSFSNTNTSPSESSSWFHSHCSTTFIILCSETPVMFRNCLNC